MADDQASAWPYGPGEMVARIRTHDWAATPLGSLRAWPQSLRTAIDIILAMPGPATVLWGPAHVQIYNDGYIPIAKERHPALLGKPVADGWSDVHADVVAPLLEEVSAGRSTQLFGYSVTLRASDGRPEERFFDTTWSPIRNEGGAVMGVLQTLVETTDTAKVQRALHESQARLSAVFESLPVAVGVTDADGRFVLVNDLMKRFVPTNIMPSRDQDRQLRWRGVDSDGEGVEPQNFPGNRALRGERIVPGQEMLYTTDDGVETWTSVATVPIYDRAGFIDGHASVISDIDATKRGAERQAYLLELSDALRPIADPVAVQEVTARTLGALLRVDRCYYAEFDWSRDILHIYHEYVGSASFSVVGSHPISLFQDLLQFSHKGEPLVCDNIATHPIYKSEIAAYRERGTDGFILVPLVKGGVMVACMCVTMATPRTWSPAEIDLVREVAERTWAAVERARAEANLRQSEERLRGFGEASTDVLWIRDADTLNWTYLTPAFETIYGLARNQAFGGNNFRNWVDLIVAEDRENAVASVQRVRRGENVTFEYRIRRPSDGAIRWLRDTDFPIRDAEGRITAIGGVGRDVTREKEANRIIRESRRDLETLVEGMAQLVWRSVDCGHWTWSSTQWSAFTGLSREASTATGWLNALHPDDREHAIEAWRQAERTDAPLDVEYRVRHAETDTYRWFQTRALPVRDEDTGRIVEWLGTSTDIDDLRQMQEAQGIMVAELQHRTRNLIAVVSSIARQTMAYTGPTEAFRAAFADRMEALSRVQGLLSQAGHERVTVRDVLETELAAHNPNGMNGDVRLDGPDVPLRKSIVQTLALALHELVTNACKYGALAGKGGDLLVRWTTSRAENEERRLFLEWIETGIAISMKSGEAVTQGGGYGRKLIEKSLPYSLRAKTTYELGADGLRCAIDLPLTKQITKEQRV